MSQIDDATRAKVKSELEANGATVSPAHPFVYSAANASNEAAAAVPSWTNWADTIQRNNAALNLAAQQQFDREQASAREAMAFEADQAQLNRDFQERMSNTAYQRARDDLEAAGFNPILAVSQGGASTPAGSTASGFKASASKAEVDIETYRTVYSSIMNLITDSVSSAISTIGNVFKVTKKI